MSEQIREAVCRLLLQTEHVWYGAFANQLEIHPSPNVPTMGVYIRDNQPVLLYNKEWTGKLTDQQVQCVIMHEIEHIVRLHCVRFLGMNDMLNIATDMVINGTRKSPALVVQDDGKTHGLPEGAVFIPDDWTKSSSEEVYAKLRQWRKEHVVNAKHDPKKGQNGQDAKHGQCGQEGKEGKDGANKGHQGGAHKGCPACQGKGGPGCPVCGTGKGHQGMDDHTGWDDANAENVRQVIKKLTEESTKAAGGAPGHLTDAIKLLNKVIIDPKSILRNHVARELGGRRPTLKRRSRRIPKFGIPGHSRRNRARLIVFIDTSGSISNKDLSDFFGIIERFTDHVSKIEVIQFDVGTTKRTAYRRGEWKKIKIIGRGGTDVDQAFDQVKDITNKDVVVALTDGYFIQPAKPRPWNMYWAITKGGQNPDWGTIVPWAS